MAKVLIAEDEGIVAMDLSMQLQALGHWVVAVTKTGIDAIEQALLIDPDLIMLDIRLKGEIDGIEAARAITTHLDIPVIFISALVDQKTMERASAVHPVEYISKPFSEDALHKAIEAALASAVPKASY
jgi:CheY-like chemotaxis protein